MPLNSRAVRNREAISFKESVMKYGDVTFGQMEAVINKLGGLDGVRRFLADEHKVVEAIAITTYRLIVDYTQNLSDMVKRGKYDWVNGDITEKNFPCAKSGSENVSVEILHLKRHFNLGISSNAAVAEMDRLGYRPATIEELLAFGAANPEIQRQFPIVALGSTCVPDGYHSVACLYGDKGGSERERHLNLHWWRGGWVDSDRFLAVRK